MDNRWRDTKNIHYSSQKLMRVFLGAPVPKDLYESLQEMVCTQNVLLPEGKWTLPENAHVTIRFLGDIESELAQALWLDFKKQVTENSISAFSIDIEKIGLFPKNNHHLIAAYLKPNTQIRQLFELANTLPIKTNSEKIFIPHITLFRAKNNREISMPMISIPCCKLNIDSIALYESRLIQEKRIYSKLHTLKFSCQANSKRSIE